MSLSKPWSTLCMLSLSVPALGFGSPFWFFSSAPDTTCPNVAAAPKAPIDMVCEAKSDSKCDTKCHPAPQCEAKPCCETKTITEVVKVCHDPCNPVHPCWEVVLSFGIGYRHDRLSQKLEPHSSSGESNLKSHYRDFDSVMGVLRLDARVSNFLFGFEGDYAPVVDGRLDQDFHTSGTSSTQDSHFRFKKMSGYEADAQVTVGYRLEFINGRHGRAYLVPQFGYRYSHQSYETDSQDKFVNRNVLAGNVTQFMQDQSPMHSEWFGPFLEARLSFVFWDHLHVEPYYQYHFLDYRARKKFAVTNITNDPLAVGALPNQQEVTKSVIRNDSARGQSAGADIYWQFKNHFRLGAKGSWLMFQTENAKAHAKSSTTVFTSNPPVTTTHGFKEHAHATWTNYSVYIYGGYSF